MRHGGHHCTLANHVGARKSVLARIQCNPASPTAFVDLRALAGNNKVALLRVELLSFSASSSSMTASSAQISTDSSAQHLNASAAMASTPEEVDAQIQKAEEKRLAGESLGNLAGPL